MKAGHHNRSPMGGPKTFGVHSGRSLIAHSAFAPILGVWGALLGGLIILVLPETVVTAKLAGAGLTGLGSAAHAVLAIGVALVFGGFLLLGAAGLSAMARAQMDAGGLAHAANSRLRPLDPVHELGTPSFDEPLSTMPFGVPDSEAQIEPHHNVGHETDEDSLPPPRAFDSAGSAELPDRNAGWVEAVADQAISIGVNPATPEQTPAPAPCVAALTRLRAVPPEQLSTIQMVERFAAALQEHRDPANGKAGQRRVTADREAALAEALKALAVLSAPERTVDVDEPLRDAIAQLQPRRGMA